MPPPVTLDGPQVPDPPKRARVHLSCTSCRRAKLKCDRNQPCSQCIKRSRQDLCEYASAPARQKPSKSMQNRLHHLESLVINMMNDQITTHQPSTSPSVLFGYTGDSAMPSAQSPNVEGPSQGTSHHSSDIGRATEVPLGETTSGQVVLGTTETSYIGATHWAAILEDIEEIRGCIHEEPDEGLAMDPFVHAAAMALGSMTVDDRAGIIAALPERSVVDRLISRYFNSNDPAMVIIHKPTFQKESVIGWTGLKYREFWENPSTKSITWIGLLFAMLCLATLSLLFAGDEPLETRDTPVEVAKRYQVLCSRCLVIDDYTKPGKYTVQTLLLNLESEFMQGGDIAKCWVLHGLLVRVALKMGYHRDARNHPNITPFQGEMRRRMWHMIAQVDLLLSFQLGLPSMIRVRQSDTSPPHNLFDDDFFEACLQLPPGRPDFEPTPMSYMICKSRICQVFGMITEQANLITQPAYDEIMELDNRLHEIYALVPPFLVDRPLSQSITDTPNLIMQRFNLTLLFHKSRCVLHRKYLTEKDPKFDHIYSKNSCIGSALELLQCQSAIHDAVQPGAPLSRDKWFLSTIAAHDFLLGAMIIYVYLTNYYKVTSMGNLHSNGMGSENQGRRRMFQCIKTSHELWIKSPKEARNAKKASQVLEMILTNLRRHISPDNDELDAFSGLQTYPSEMVQTSDNGSPMIPAFEPYNTNNQPPLGFWNDLERMIEMPDNLNWESWDSQINEPATEISNYLWASDIVFEDIILPDDTDVDEQSQI